MTSSEDAQPAVAATGAEPIAIVVGHGDFAAGMVSAVAQITGRGDRLLSLTNRELGPAEIERALHTLAASHPVQVVFTDLPGGSCTIAARRLLRERPDLVLVTGTNLVTLLDFVLGADDPPDQGAAGANGAQAVVTHAAEKGRAALVAHLPTAAPSLAFPAAPAAPAREPASAVPGAEVGGAD